VNRNSKIFVAGHSGLVGSCILNFLKKKDYNNIHIISKKKLDLRNQNKVQKFFIKNKFDFVINVAGKVGGILANNKFRADFIYDNLMIQTNIVHSSYLTKVKGLIFVASSSIYPKNNHALTENDLLKGSLEKTNEPYSIAKIAGIKICENYNIQYGTNFKCLVPCNLYGPNDSYHIQNAHFIPALIKKIYFAKKNNKPVNLWGDGKSKREVMYAEDLANACLFFLKKKTKETLINVGSGNEKTILDFAKIISKKIGYNNKIKFDKSKPNGVKRKLLDSSVANKYGWNSMISLDYGLDLTIKDFINKFGEQMENSF
jgi:GDP-L-fucose synthase